METRLSLPRVFTVGFRNTCGAALDCRSQAVAWFLPVCIGRAGAADLAAIRNIFRAIGGVIPIVSNGNVRQWRDVVANAATTCCDGVMVAEAVLADPSLFAVPAARAGAASLPPAAAAAAAVSGSGAVSAASVLCPPSLPSGAAAVAPDGHSCPSLGSCGRGTCGGTDGPFLTADAALTVSDGTADGFSTGAGASDCRKRHRYDDGGTVVAGDGVAVGSCGNVGCGGTGGEISVEEPLFVLGGEDDDYVDDVGARGARAADDDSGVISSPFVRFCDGERARIGVVALEYLALARAHPPPLFDYARRHVCYFLRRRGRGARTQFQVSCVVLCAALLLSARDPCQLRGSCKCTVETPLPLCDGMCCCS